jgi:hypothetical protein
MKTQLLFSSVPYNLSDVPLGSLVPNPLHPIQDALSVLTAKADIDYTVRTQQDFNGLLDATSTSSFRAQITRLLNLARNKTTTSSLELKAKAGSAYELKAPTTFFKLACAEPKVRTWLQEGLEQGDDAFFVIGLRTFRDASVVGQSQRQNESLKGGATVPVGDVVKTNTGISTGDALDAKVAGEKSEERGGQQSYKTEGERVYAICYRKVKLSTRSISDAVLRKDVEWKLYSDQRDGDPNEPMQEMCTAELEEFDFAVESGVSTNLDRTSDADGTEYFVEKDVDIQPSQ